LSRALRNRVRAGNRYSSKKFPKTSQVIGLKKKKKNFLHLLTRLNSFILTPKVIF
jgi:hypothetical protein